MMQSLNTFKQFITIKLQNNPNIDKYLAIFSVILFTLTLNYALGGKPKLHPIISAFIFFILAEYKYLFNAFVLIISLFAAIYAPIGLMYREITASIMVSILQTGKQEASEFITGMPASVYVVIVLIAVFAVLMIRIRPKICLQRRNSKIWLLSILLLHSFLYEEINQILTLQKSLADSRNFVLATAHTIHNAYQGAKDFIANNPNANAKPDWQPSAVNPKFPTYVVIIGESVRRDAMHAYGFNLENTQFLSNVPRIQFNDYLSASSYTVPSLSNMFLLNNLAIPILLIM